MDFTQSLDRKLEEIERPPNLPIGHYIWQINKVPEQDDFESKTTGNKFNRVTVQCVCVEPTDDVDEDDLAAYGKVAGAMNRKSFLFSDPDDDPAAFQRSLFNIRRFLGHCGVDESLTVNEGLSDLMGKTFMGELTHRADPNDPEIVYAEIGKTAEV